MQNYSVNKWLRKTMSIFTIQASILIVTCSITLAHDNYAQVLDREVTVSLKEVKFKNALTEIENAAHVKFVYSDEQMPLSKSVSLIADRKKLNELLIELLQPYGIDFEADDNTEFVALKRIKKTIGDKQSIIESPAQPNKNEIKNANVSGLVTDEVTSQPLAGVNVITKGTTNGTSTDATGRYVINAEGGDILVFSFIGYVSQEIPINDRTIIDLTLKEDVKSLDEVTVNAGYWNVNEKEKTGNISKITSDAIQKQPVSNPLLAMQGRMAGVNIRQSSGVPGAAISVQVRGRNSLRSDNFINEPLYIVDGVPFTSVSLSSVAGSVIPSANPLNSINPSDIESIEVLKDADATSIYGARGSNGVVLITTKKGKAGKTNVIVDLYSGVGKVSKTLDLLNTAQYIEMRNESFRNDGTPPQSSNYDINGTWDQTRYTDWQKALIGGTAHVTNAQVSLSGGNENTQFLLSAGYFKQSTVFPGDFADQKASGNFNLNHIHPNKKLRVSMSLNYVIDNNQLPSVDYTQQAITLSPNAPALYLETGALNWENGTWTNPLASVLKRYKGQTNNFIANTTIGYELIKGLTVKSNLGYTRIGMNETLLTPIASYSPSLNVTQGSNNFGNATVTTWIIEPQTEYIKNLGLGKLTVLVGSTFQQNLREQANYSAFGFTSDALLQNIKSASSISINSSDVTQYRYASLFGRLNYNHDGKYIANVTGRRDGSSRFGSGKRLGNFGAVGMAWIFSNEGFLQTQSLLSFGKLRSSYGTSGSDQIGDYQYLDTYSSSRYPYQGGSGLIPTQLVNPDYAWEVNKKFEVAIELGFIQNRVLLSASWYKNLSSNQLIGYPLSAVTGFATIQSNLPATVKNSGLEIELQTTNLKRDHFGWSTSFNVTVPRSQLVSFDNIERTAYTNIYEVGKSLNVVKRLTYEGVNPETGLYKFTDSNGNGIVDDYQFFEYGENFYGGLQNTLTFKGIQLDVLFQFMKQTVPTPYGGIFQAPGFTSNQPVEFLNRWQQAGDNAMYQRYTQAFGDGFTSRSNYSNSTATLTDGSFLRLKNLSLSWQLPNQWLQKSHMAGAKIYLQGQNLLTFSNYPGLDPETRTSGFLPALRMLVGGVQLTL